MDRELFVGAGCFVALVLGGMITTAVEPQLRAPVGMTQHQKEALEESAVASVFGEFRSSMADFFWLESERYLHSGVETRGRLESEKKDKKVGEVTGTSSHDTHHEETTVVPAAASDWRGILGHIERQTQPYMDMSHHTEKSPKEVLPLLRMATWSNPHFVQGYVNGAIQMVHLPGKKEEALAFLLEGERNNPDSISIEATLCEIYFRHFAKPEVAEPYGRRALELYAHKDPQILSLDEKEDANGAFRWLVGIYRDLGDAQKKAGDTAKAEVLYGAGRGIATECLRHFPDDPTAIIFLRAHPGK
jgi:hypothetical protein